MKKLIISSLLLVCCISVVPTPSIAKLNAAAVEVMDTPPLSNNDLMKLLHIVKREFGWSMSHTRNLYESGLVTITPMPSEGDGVYMLAYDSWCILAALEDRL